MDGGLALSDSYCLYEDNVITGCLTEEYGFSGLAGYSSQASCARRRPDKRVRVFGQGFHPGLVSKDGALAPLAGRVDRQNRKLVSGSGDVASESFYECALSGSRNASYTYSHCTDLALAYLLLATDDYLFCQCPVGRIGAFYHCNSLSQNGPISCKNAFQVFLGCKYGRFLLYKEVLYVRIYSGLGIYSVVNH